VIAEGKVCLESLGLRRFSGAGFDVWQVDCPIVSEENPGLSTIIGPENDMLLKNWLF